MRTESGTSGPGLVTACSDVVDNFGHDVRVEKIDRLRKYIAENTYHVKAVDLARKIIDDMLQL